MKQTTLAITQMVDKYDKAGYQAAVQVALTKIDQLGLNDYDRASLELSLGPTDISFTVDTITEPEQSEPIEE